MFSSETLTRSVGALKPEQTPRPYTWPAQNLTTEERQILRLHYVEREAAALRKKCHNDCCWYRHQQQSLYGRHPRLTTMDAGVLSIGLLHLAEAAPLSVRRTLRNKSRRWQERARELEHRDAEKAFRWELYAILKSEQSGLWLA
jgi:hypothetical protein